MRRHHRLETRKMTPRVRESRKEKLRRYFIHLLIVQSIYQMLVTCVLQTFTKLMNCVLKVDFKGSSKHLLILLLKQ